MINTEVFPAIRMKIDRLLKITNAKSAGQPVISRVEGL